MGLNIAQRHRDDRDMIRAVSDRYDVRNIAAVMARITHIVRTALKARELKDAKEQ